MPAITRWDITAEADDTSGAAIEDRRRFLAQVQRLQSSACRSRCPSPSRLSKRRAA
jgi:hypothetical protein